ncbi:hypothetical protein CVIRNUC_011207 [Coccomyxa viridis]|uniref:Tubulin-specific chaperone A n=1 Tax=Coccomyxa viridis TaxID=1274662 RepID=A0AAV1IP92_9CHLO|nr:hypothetical protein CVIRNUC_011207 [Coccomyxa viridis]
MADTEKRMLKIKTGSVVRLNKELGLYETEKEAEAKRVAKMRDEGADAYDIKHAVSVLEEAKIMIPDTRQRLEGALQDLTGYVVGSLTYSTALRALPVL